MSVPTAANVTKLSFEWECFLLLNGKFLTALKWSFKIRHHIPNANFLGGLNFHKPWVNRHERSGYTVMTRLFDSVICIGASFFKLFVLFSCFIIVNIHGLFIMLQTMILLADNVVSL